MNNLKHYRKQAGITQQDLAERVGISHRTLQDYEQGSKPLEKAAAITVLKMARVLGCTVEELILTPDTAAELEQAVQKRHEHQPIIDRETYEAVQKKLGHKPKVKWNTPDPAKAERREDLPAGYKYDESGNIVVDGPAAEKIRAAIEKETATIEGERWETVHSTK